MTTQKNILIFEDDDADYLLLQTMFNDMHKEQYNLTRAIRISDFEKSDTGSIDLIIMDYQLPDDTGINIVQKLKAEHGNFAPIIFLTGRDDPDLYEALKQIGVYDYFVKSEMTPSLLERACFYAIERFQANRLYAQEREFSYYMAENVPHYIVRIDQNGSVRLANNNFLNFKNKLENSNKGYEDFLTQLQTKYSDFSYTYILNNETYYTKWLYIRMQFNDQFTYIGEDITHEIKQQEAELGRRKLEALGHLAGGIAHELNNTLQPIILRNDLIHDIAAHINHHHIIAHSEEISIMLRHGASIIRDILDYSASHDSAIPYHKTDHYDDFRTSIALIKRSLPDKITLNIKGENHLKNINILIADNDLLKILSNIIRNAALSMDMEGRINIQIRKKNEILAISVQDYGCGMPPSIIEKIFTPFFTTRPPGSGTGLGLSVVSSIMNKYDGTIEVDSIENNGTTITLLFPVVS